MLSNKEYIRLSLELNVFFMRIAKEHFFYGDSLGIKDQTLAQQADALKNHFSAILYFWIISCVKPAFT